MILIISLGGDWNISSTPAYVEQLPELRMYVARFYRLSKTYLPEGREIVPMDKISLRFASLSDFSDEMVGLCTRPAIKGITSPIVSVYKLYCYSVPPVIKERLVFHELGHCALDRDHNENIHDFHVGIGNDSLMFPNLDLKSVFLYYMYREHYLAELFQGQ